MKKLLSLLCALIFILVSCAEPVTPPETQVTDTQPAESETSDAPTTETTDTEPPESETTDTQPPETEPTETDPPEPEIYPMPILDYMREGTVSHYDDMTEDQKMAYDVLFEALYDILENGPEPGKSYPLERRIRWYDYKTAYNLLYANYIGVEDIVTCLVDRDSLWTSDYVDSVEVWCAEPSLLEEYYSKYLAVKEGAEAILASLEHDGTDYGKAYAICRWFMENVVYAYSYMERGIEKFNSAYSAIVNHETICDGYSKAFDYLAKRAGLESIYMTGNSIGGGHAWNMLKVDGKWYHVDTTWMTAEYNFYDNFMVTDAVARYTGHLSWEYWWLQEPNIYITPVADSYDYYHYALDSAEEYIALMQERMDNGALVGGFAAVFPRMTREEVLDMDGTIFYSDTWGSDVVVSVTEESYPLFRLDVEAIDAEVKALADHLIHNTMTPEWLEEGYTVTDADLQKFICGTILFRDNPHHPYSSTPQLKTEDTTRYWLISSYNAKKMVREVFGLADWEPDSEKCTGYDLQKGGFIVPDGIGLGSRQLSYSIIDYRVQYNTGESGYTVLMDVRLEKAYEEVPEETYVYGSYQLVFRRCYDGTDSWLRFEGIISLDGAVG